MINEIWPYFGDLHRILPAHLSGIILVRCSVVCGLLIGAERESKQKPAGLRTITLISVGSTIFTLASILIAGSSGVAADPARIAAQVVTGIGFLGAGAILQYRGTVLGLTTGATIWTAAAIGVLVGGGYAAAGLVLTVLVVGVLTAVQRIEDLVLGPCCFVQVQIVYETDHGKTRIRIRHVLDEFRVPDDYWTVRAKADQEVMEIRHCHVHGQHRAVLYEIANLPGVVELRGEPAPRHGNGPQLDAM